MNRRRFLLAAFPAAVLFAPAARGAGRPYRGDLPEPYRSGRDTRPRALLLSRLAELEDRVRLAYREGILGPREEDRLRARLDRVRGFLRRDRELDRREFERRSRDLDSIAGELSDRARGRRGS